MIADAIRGFFQSAAESINPVHPRDPALAKMFGLGSGTFSGIDVTHDKVAALPAVIRGVTIISSAMRKMPFYVFRESEEGRTWDKSHPSWQAVAVKPHPNITRGTFRENLNSWAMLWGNAYAYIDRPNWPQGPISLIPMLPDRTFPYRVSRSGSATDNLEDEDGMLRFATRVGGELRTFDESEVLHVHGIGPNPYIGWDIVELMKETFGGAIANQQFGNRFFGQGANPAGFVMMDGSLEEEEEENFMASLQKAMSGLAKSHKVVLLEEGAKFQALTVDPQKAQFLEGKQFDVRQLAMSIGIKVHKLIDGANSSYASLEQGNQEHRDDDVIPWVGRWSEEMEDKLLTERQKQEGTHSIGVDDEAMTWVPFRERASGVVELYNNGLIEKDEGRRKVNFGPSGANRAKDFRIPSNIVYEDDAALIPASEPDDETTPDESSKFAEVATAYLARIAVRLQKAANSKAAKGSKEFIAWVDGLTTEAGPESLQPMIDELYTSVSMTCNRVTRTATEDELMEQTRLVADLFPEFVQQIFDRQKLAAIKEVLTCKS